MCDTLFFILNKSTLQYNYLKVKESLKSIQDNHPNRTDLIKSMSETEQDLLNSINCWKAVQEEHTILSKRLIALEQQNIVLLNEIKEIKNINRNIINDLEL